jgi:endonuclease/exonuclease/phosphatase family metal-dependent hydrolase
MRRQRKEKYGMKTAIYRGSIPLQGITRNKKSRQLYSNTTNPMKLLLPALVLGLLLVACGKQGGDISGSDLVPLDTGAILLDPDPMQPVDSLRVATLNFSLGFPVSQLIFKAMNIDTVAYDELSRLDSLFLLGRPNERIIAMADSCAASGAQVFGLQEVMTYWRNDELISDFLDGFMQRLTITSGKNWKSALHILNDSTLTGRRGGDSIAIHFREGNALVWNAAWDSLGYQDSLFENLLPIPIPGAKPTERGVQFLSLGHPNGIRLQIFNTHLEVLTPYRPNQAAEMAAFVNSVWTPGVTQVLLGDLNAEVDDDAYRLLTQDWNWYDAMTGAPGDTSTCCLAGSALWNPAAEFSARRIDHIFAKRVWGVGDREVQIKGTFVNTEGNPQFSSDHRMVVASLLLQNP